MTRRPAIVLAALFAACLLSGCSAPELKGTPFYTGEYVRREGPPEDRVNLWPLVYYRKPALSVLWPIGEYVEDEHLAVRPLFSVYDLDQDQRHVNVLWPWASFDPQEREYRVFPAFWGKNVWKKPYFVLFPFVWYSKDTHAGVWPVWMHYDRPGGSSVHALWPIFNRKTGQGETGWRAWPLLGHYEEGDHSRSYALWPLAMSLKEGEEVSRWAFPLYFGARKAKAAWDVLLPVFYRYRSADEKGTALLPFFYNGTDADGTRTTVTPLYMGQRKADSLWDVVLPLYYRSQTPAGRESAVFPLYYRGQDESGTKTTLLPLFYRSADADGTRTTVTPLYMGQRKADSLWDMVLPLFFRHRDPESRRTVLLPVYYDSERGQTKTQMVFPLYLNWTDGDARMFLTLPGGFSRSGEKRTVYAFPLLSSYTTSPTEKELWLASPLSHWRWNGGLQEAHVLPLFYWHGKDGVFLSLLWSAKTKGESRWWSLLGPLAIRRSGDDHPSLDLLWPLFHAGRKGDTVSHWLFPLWEYTGSPDEDSLILGPLLAVYERHGEDRELYVIPPLIRAAWGQQKLAHYAWPLYSYDRGDDGTKLQLGPFLEDLSLAGAEWGEDRLEHYAWPLYSYDGRDDGAKLQLGPFLEDLSLAGGEWDEEKLKHFAWPLYFYDHHGDNGELLLGPYLGDVALAGRRWREGRSSLWAFPLFWSKSRRSAEWEEGESRYRVDVQHRDFTAFPLVWYESAEPLKETRELVEEPQDEEERRPRGGRGPEPSSRLLVLPLFGYRRSGTPDEEGGIGEKQFRLLAFLYDSLKEVTPAEDDPDARDVYVRRRVLWRVVHYERVNDKTALDVFPGITYDSEPGEKKVVSVFWRVFRYERQKGERARYHVLFIPFGGGEEE